MEEAGHSASLRAMQAMQGVVPENFHTAPPGKIIENSEAEGGFKDSNFRRVGGFMWIYFPKVNGPPTKILKATYDRSKAQKHTHVRSFEKKVSTPGHWQEVNIISFNVSVILSVT